MLSHVLKIILIKTLQSQKSEAGSVCLQIGHDPPLPFIFVKPQ